MVSGGEGEAAAASDEDANAERDAAAPGRRVAKAGSSGAGLEWLALAAFCGASLLLYSEAFEGTFFSDDLHNIVGNEYIHSFSASNTLELLRPSGAPAKLTQNYAPLHMLAHALEWAAFRDGVVAYHVVNALLHGVASFLLVVVLARSGVGRMAALLGGAFFLVHPANVESVAWIYQLKTIQALILAQVALLLFDRRPALGCAAFVAALLTKALAAFALPVALALWWSRSASSDRQPSQASQSSQPDQRAQRNRRQLAWLGLWAFGLTVYALSAFGIFTSTNANVSALDTSPWVVARTVVAIGGRYLLMSLSSYGVSAFQEVALARSWADAWWLGSAVVLGLLAYRGVGALLQRREEGAYWLWAACSFAPISQLFPFLHPMADRYLYFILPGLIGGVLLAAGNVLDASALRRRALQWVALAVCAGVLVAFTARSVERVRLWRFPVMLEKEAVRNFPNGLLANNLRARKAASVGDADTALAALRLTVERGDLRFRELLGDPAWAPLRGDPRFQAAIADMAQRWLNLLPQYRDPSQIELYGFSEAAALLMQYDLAESLLIQALETGGIRDDMVRGQLERVRRARALSGESEAPAAPP